MARPPNNMVERRIEMKEVRLYLVMMAFFSFAMGMSNLFINIFIWKIDQSYLTLAIYSLMYSAVVLISFPLCSLYARKRTPMASLRVGVLLFIFTYALVMFYKEKAAYHIYEIGFWMGMGTSFFAIGMHMQTLDSTQDDGRDKFLYIGNFLNSISGMVAPLLSGFLINYYAGMKGYYVVFGISLFWFVLVVLISLKMKGKYISNTSQFHDVWKKPTKEWKGMYWVTIGSGIVEGTYSTFLVTMMTYSILKSELSLGGFATFTSLVGLLTSILLAKISTPNRRIGLYTVGAVLICVSSIWLSIESSYMVLVIYSIFSSIGNNIINTTLDVWTYASIEKDPKYHARRLDYIIIREIPLGIGRMAGIVFFLLLNTFFSKEKILSISFGFFGVLFILLVPLLRKIWRQPNESKPIYSSSRDFQ
ncbi:MAG: MFS transporter [Bacillota bacterium]|nr:MFS transporter [Bacillota bacterium]